MARLPRADLGGGAPSFGASPRINPAALAAPGQALADLGHQISDTAQAYGEIAVQKQREQDGLSADAALATFRAEETRRLLDAQQNADVGAPEFTSGFMTEFDARQKALLDSLPESVREDARVDLINMRGDFDVSAAQFEIKARIAGKELRLDETAMTYANLLRDDPAQLDAALDAVTRSVAASGLPAQAQAELLAEYEGTLVISAVRAMNQRDPEGTLDKLQSGIFDTYLDATQKETLLNDNRVEMNRVAAERAAHRAQAREVVDDVLDLYGDGHRPTQALLDAAHAAAAGDPELEAELVQAQALGDFTQSLKGADDVALAQAIADLESRHTLEGATVLSAQALDLARDVRNDRGGALERDALAYGAEAGIVALDAIDPADPASVAARVTAAMAVEAQYNTPALPFLEPELDNLADRWTGGTAESRAALVSALVDTPMPDAMRARLLDRVSGTLPVMGLVATLAEQGDDALVADVLAGSDILVNNPDLKPTPLERGDAGFGDTLDNLFVLDRAGEGRAAVRETVDAVYAALLRGEEPRGGFDSDLYEQATERVLGPMMELNGRTLVLPPGMDERGFAAWHSGITDEDLAGMGAPGFVDGLTGAFRAMTAEEFREAQLLWLGQGDYAVGFDYGDGDVRPVVQSDGTRFTLSVAP